MPPAWLARSVFTSKKPGLVKAYCRKLVPKPRIKRFNKLEESYKIEEFVKNYPPEVQTPPTPGPAGPRACKFLLSNQQCEVRVRLVLFLSLQHLLRFNKRCQQQQQMAPNTEPKIECAKDQGERLPMGVG